MVVYEFYRRNPSGEDKLIGVLPERRKDKERITHQSIMNWARLLVPEQIFSDKVYFVRVEGKSNSQGKAGLCELRKSGLSMERRIMACRFRSLFGTWSQ